MVRRFVFVIVFGRRRSRTWSLVRWSFHLVRSISVAVPLVYVACTLEGALGVGRDGLRLHARRIRNHRATDGERQGAAARERDAHAGEGGEGGRGPRGLLAERGGDRSAAPPREPPKQPLSLSPKGAKDRNGEAEDTHPTGARRTAQVVGRRRALELAVAGERRRGGTVVHGQRGARRVQGLHVDEVNRKCWVLLSVSEVVAR